MDYDRPFLTYEEQLNRLKTEYEMETTINGELEISFLNTVSYYDLINGYKDIFMKDNKFISGIDLSEIFVFSLVDKKFQNILFLYSVYVENVYKTKLSYLIGKTRGVSVNDYMKIDTYNALPTRVNKLKDTISNIKNVASKTNENPTKYYRLNHNHIPPWILFKNCNFNDTIDLFSFLKKTEKLEIVSDYAFLKNSKIDDNDKIELLKNALTTVRKYRNKIAHNYKVVGVKLERTNINLNIYRQVVPYQFITRRDIKKGIGKQDFYSMILSIFLLLEHPILQLSFLKDLASFDIDGSEIYFRACNFPKDFLKMIKEIEKKHKEKLLTKPLSNEKSV